jgi:hypothetical protein
MIKVDDKQYVQISSVRAFRDVHSKSTCDNDELYMIET